MWSFVEVARIERTWGRWNALVTLENSVVRESFWLAYGINEPTSEAVTARGQQMAADRNEDCAQGEFWYMVDANVWATLAYQTKAQLADRFRAAYRNASKLRAALLATWLLARIADGTFTDAQVRTAFGLTTIQYNAMKTRMTTLRDHWLAVDASAGE